jgi:hypothetical protein
MAERKFGLGEVKSAYPGNLSSNSLNFNQHSLLIFLYVQT